MSETILKDYINLLCDDSKKTQIGPRKTIYSFDIPPIYRSQQMGREMTITLTSSTNIYKPEYEHMSDSIELYIDCDNSFRNHYSSDVSLQNNFAYLSSSRYDAAVTSESPVSYNKHVSFSGNKPPVYKLDNLPTNIQLLFLTDNPSEIVSSMVVLEVSYYTEVREINNAYVNHAVNSLQVGTHHL
jgi:hypothetical protein